MCVRGEVVTHRCAGEPRRDPQGPAESLPAYREVVTLGRGVQVRPAAGCGGLSDRVRRPAGRAHPSRRSPATTRSWRPASDIRRRSGPGRSSGPRDPGMQERCVHAPLLTTLARSGQRYRTGAQASARSSSRCQVRPRASALRVDPSPGLPGGATRVAAAATASPGSVDPVPAARLGASAPAPGRARSRRSAASAKSRRLGQSRSSAPAASTTSPSIALPRVRREHRSAPARGRCSTGDALARVDHAARGTRTSPSTSIGRSSRQRGRRCRSPRAARSSGWRWSTSFGEPGGDRRRPRPRGVPSSSAASTPRDAPGLRPRRAAVTSPRDVLERSRAGRDDGRPPEPRYATRWLAVLPRARGTRSSTSRTLAHSDLSEDPAYWPALERRSSATELSPRRLGCLVASGCRCASR